MTIPSRYDLTDQIPPKHYTKCDNCECVKHDSEFYKHTPNTCMDCLNKDSDEAEARFMRFNRPEIQRY